MMALDQKSLDPDVNMNICAEGHGNPSNCSFHSQSFVAWPGSKRKKTQPWGEWNTVMREDISESNENVWI